MKQFSILLLALVLLAFTGPLAAQNGPAASDKAADEGAHIKWMTFEEAVAACRVKPKKLIIDMYTDWCGWCKRMDANTFDNPEISKYISENYYAVKFNAEQKEDIVFDNHTFKHVAGGRNGIHELAIALNDGKSPGYPTIVFMDEKFYLIQSLPGYKTPDQMDPILKYFGSDSHLNTKWEDFMKTYKSPFPAGTAPTTPGAGH